MKAVRCEKSRLRFAVGTFLQGEQVWDFEKFFSLAELPSQAGAKVLLSSLFPYHFHAIHFFLAAEPDRGRVIGLEEALGAAGQAIHRHGLVVFYAIGPDGGSA